MSSEYENRKALYLARLVKEINNNPKVFSDLNAPSEMRGLQYLEPDRESSNAAAQWAKYLSAKPSETERAFNAGAYDGFAFGLNDELDAAGNAVHAWFDDRDVAAAYDAKLAQARAEAQYLQDQHPIAYTGGTIVGSLAQPANYAGIGWATRGATLGAQGLRAAGVGFGNGALHGFASGEGGVEERLENAVKEGAIGSVAGLAPAAGHYVTEPATRALARVVATTDAEVETVKSFIRNMQYGADGGLDWSRLPAHLRDLFIKPSESALRRRAQVLRNAEFDTTTKASPVWRDGEQVYQYTQDLVPEADVENLMHGWVGRLKDIYPTRKGNVGYVSKDKFRRARPAEPKRSRHSTTGVQANFERKLTPSSKNFGLNAHVDVYR